MIRFYSFFIFVLTKLLAVLIFLLFKLHIVFYKLCFVDYSISKIYLIVIQNRLNKEDGPDMMVVLREALIIRFIYNAS